MKYAVLHRYVDKVLKELDADNRKLLRKAAIHTARKVRAKINRNNPSLPGEPPGKFTGNLKKGVGIKTYKSVALVGVQTPAHHAHLLEFGTDKMEPRPFLFPTFAEESRIVKQILSEERLS